MIPLAFISPLSILSMVTVSDLNYWDHCGFQGLPDAVAHYSTQQGSIDTSLSDGYTQHLARTALEQTVLLWALLCPERCIYKEVHLCQQHLAEQGMAYSLVSSWKTCLVHLPCSSSIFLCFSTIPWIQHSRFSSSFWKICRNAFTFASQIFEDAVTFSVYLNRYENHWKKLTVF